MTNWERYANSEVLQPTYENKLPKSRIVIDESKVIKTKPFAIRQGVDISLLPFTLLVILVVLWLITGLKYWLN